MAWFKDWFNTTYYHLLYGERDEKEASEFIQELLRFLKPSKSSVFLDLACGKGRHAFDIASSGYAVIGVDLSFESIQQARQYPLDNLYFEVHDMRNAYKKDHFNYVLNLFTSFGYFDNAEDNQKTLDAVVSNLQNKGLFIQDYFNANKVKKILKPMETKRIEGIDFTINKEIKDNFILKTISFEDQGQAYQFCERVNLFDLEGFKSLYNAAGLEILHTFGDYKLSPFNPETSDRLILISQKIK